MIKAAVSLSIDLSKGSCNNSMGDFKILKFFKTTLHAAKAPVITQVDWYKPPCSSIKCNSDGASRGNLGSAATGSIFRDSSGAVRCWLFFRLFRGFNITKS